MYLTTLLTLLLGILMILGAFFLGGYLEKKRSVKLKNELADERKTLKGLDNDRNVFLAQMSHELRNPINVILGCADMMKNERFGALSSKYKEYSEDILSSGRHLMSIFESILDMSRIESGKWKPQESFFDPEIMLRTLKRTYQKSVEAQQVAIYVFSKLPVGASIFADTVAIRQVLSNLLENSIRHTLSGGVCSIELWASEANLVFDVRDSGSGFSKQDIENALVPFGRGGRWREKSGSMGLGIPIAQGLVELHGGRLEIEPSKVEEGALIKVLLPIKRLKLAQV